MTNIELFEIALKDKICVESFPLPKNKSVSVRYGNRYYVAIDNTEKSDAEEKVHLAHELGHCETNSFYNIHAPLDLREKHEYRANKWAVKKLIPKDELTELLKKNVAKWDIAEHFGVTESFLNLALIMYFEHGITV